MMRTQCEGGANTIQVELHADDADQTDYRRFFFNGTLITQIFYDGTQIWAFSVQRSATSFVVSSGKRD